jgi:hypothetical protein
MTVSFGVRRDEKSFFEEDVMLCIHGIPLSLSYLDTQGLSRGEAAASGALHMVGASLLSLCLGLHYM